MPVPTGVRVALGVFCGEAFERVLDDLGLECPATIINSLNDN